MKNLLSKIIIITLVISGFSCGEDIPDCPSKMCVIAGGWKLVEAYADDVKETQDLSKYRLNLTSPTPTTATTSDFSRTQPSGTSDAGIWSIENNQTVLRLTPDNDPSLKEDYIIETFTPRQLVLVINRDVTIKQGPSKIKFVLEPY